MFNIRLTELIEERYSNRKQFAQEFGVPYTTLNNWVDTTKPTEPDYETLCKLADFFGISIDYLLGRTDNMFLQSGNTTLNVPKRIFDLAVLAQSLGKKELDCLESFGGYLKDSKRKG